MDARPNLRDGSRLLPAPDAAKMFYQKIIQESFKLKQSIVYFLLY